MENCNLPTKWPENYSQADMQTVWEVTPASVVNAGKDDVYDFYLCDTGNHCIRKITPEGAVSTYAGRGTASADGKVDGYIDGDLRTEARFLEPTGIAYDEDNGTFYIADRGNKRIRFIAIE